MILEKNAEVCVVHDTGFYVWWCVLYLSHDALTHKLCTQKGKELKNCIIINTFHLVINMCSIFCYVFNLLL